MSLLRNTVRHITRQGWIPRGRMLLAKTFCDHNKINDDIQFTEDFFDLRYSGRLNNWIDWHIYFFGAYAPGELALLGALAKSLRAGNTAPIIYYDIGCNVGNHAIYMSRYADEVLCFDPSPTAISAAKANIHLNNLQNVMTFEVALGSVKKNAPLFLPEAHNLGTATLLQRRTSGLAPPIGHVDIEVGDEFVRHHELPLPDLVKLDVEGFESEVIRGLGNTLSMARPVIFCELTGIDLSGFGSEAGLRAALPNYYRLFSFDARHDSARYRLSKFTTKYKMVLCVPSEKAAILSAAVRIDTHDT